MERQRWLDDAIVPRMTDKMLDFWLEYASTYSYVAAERIGALARAAGVSVRWCPFLLGPIFQSQGWNTSPFNIYPGKGRYMWRDMERLCQSHGLPLKRLEVFPQKSILAARVALIGFDAGWGGAFSRAVYRAEFGEGKNIGDNAVIADILGKIGHDAPRVLEQAQTVENKARLRSKTEEAQRLGIFGAPSFVTADGELFWGNDRLEAALAWACK
jgi:2-hydroxychromene-2-carboxylate isomerase